MGNTARRDLVVCRGSCLCRLCHLESSRSATGAHGRIFERSAQFEAGIDCTRRSQVFLYPGQPDGPAIMVPGPTRVARRVEIGSGLPRMAAVNFSYSPTVLSALTDRTAVSLVNRHTAVHDWGCNLQPHKFIQYPFLTDPEAIVR
jgi:hypothetical protein